jgi:uncharacterized alpha-E superfamily protein
MMLARVAEHLYWTARYLERAEDTARWINAITYVLLDLPRDVGFGWQPLLKVAGLEEIFQPGGRPAEERNVIEFLLKEPHNPSSVMSCIRNARENARTFREVLPRENWELVNELYLFASDRLPEASDRRRRFEVLHEVIRRTQVVTGLLEGTMNRDEAYQFLALGRLIERADMTTRVLDVSHALILPEGSGAAYYDLLWLSALKSLSAYQMYRRNVGVHARGSRVIEFLVKDRRFPRSVRYCLSEIERAVSALPAPAAPLGDVQIAKAIVDSVDVRRFAERGLHRFCDHVQSALGRIHDTLTTVYFRLQTTPDRLRIAPVRERAMQQ